ncbi:hypothetical protein XarbCFBP7408_20075 [Xanthomonas arboricola pv. guizotiae]|uniref:Uncharacterized protein n=1 Tax=Xanthomonas arboricola pv. guizotiae TaxID=487867 RepID=A0A2S6ZQ08_9XANT|nr:hypothetical protein XarbCFBP7409_19500 [Xanthomonas arboricola pv. guizotiae]PPU18714.1 hypothetical protein XarbCFBP7408_20075 [Xanthomonas arboricola pv. guizotiae]
MQVVTIIGAGAEWTAWHVALTLAVFHGTAPVMTERMAYPIGTPRQPWGESERAAWRARQLRQRSHAVDVVQAIEALDARYERSAGIRVKNSQKWDNLLLVKNFFTDSCRPSWRRRSPRFRPAVRSRSAATAS